MNVFEKNRVSRMVGLLTILLIVALNGVAFADTDWDLSRETLVARVNGGTNNR